MAKTKRLYERELNELGRSLPEEDFIIGGKLRHGEHGTMLRKHDPISFRVGYNEWKLI